MRSSLGVPYYADSGAFDKGKIDLKRFSCPHCGAVGQLIWHGCLRGHGPKGEADAVRGWRVFCSNRHRRRGCGRTIPIYLSTTLRRRFFRAPQLWRFLQGVAQGPIRRAAWRRVGAEGQTRSAYRLWARFVQSLSRIRSCLWRCGVAPSGSSTLADPALETIAHLQRVFAEAPCAVSAFQRTFQQGFLV